MTLQTLLIVWIAILLCACRPDTTDQSTANTGQQRVSPETEITIIAFGDSGYHPDYLHKKYFNRPFTTEQDFIDDYKRKWLESDRPIDEFAVPTLEFHTASGSYIPKSSLYTVANAMTSHCRQNTCDFAVMVGDNIYPDGATLGADGIDDATRFRDLLSLPFAAMGNNQPHFKIYATLGNHDWHTSRAGAMAQVEFMRNNDMFYMDGLFYSVQPPAANGQLELFVVDTEMLLAGTKVKKALRNKDGSEKNHDMYKTPRASAMPQTDEEKAMVEWLARALQTSTASWKVVVGHHPLWSAGGAKFEQARALRRLIRPLLCEHADAYLAGHEHTLEVYADSCSDIGGVNRNKDLVQIVSGAAGKKRSVHSPFVAQQNLAYPQRKMLFAEGMIAGFAQISMKQGVIDVAMFIAEDDGSIKQTFTHTF